LQESATQSKIAIIVEESRTPTTAKSAHGVACHVPCSVTLRMIYTCSILHAKPAARFLAHPTLPAILRISLAAICFTLYTHAFIFARIVLVAPSTLVAVLCTPGAA